MPEYHKNMYISKQLLELDILLKMILFVNY